MLAQFHRVILVLGHDGVLWKRHGGSYATPASSAMAQIEPRTLCESAKNDDLDAEAIAEAATRPTMRFVEVKSQAQSDIQTLHRARERLVSERTALINHLRALLLERGIVAPQGRRKLEEELSVFADDPRRFRSDLFVSRLSKSADFAFA
jgi:hypothetical protein